MRRVVVCVCCMYVWLFRLVCLGLYGHCICFHYFVCSYISVICNWYQVFIRIYLSKTRAHLQTTKFILTHTHARTYTHTHYLASWQLCYSRTQNFILPFWRYFIANNAIIVFILTFANYHWHWCLGAEMGRHTYTYRCLCLSRFLIPKCVFLYWTEHFIHITRIWGFQTLLLM